MVNSIGAGGSFPITPILSKDLNTLDYFHRKQQHQRTNRFHKIGQIKNLVQLHDHPSYQAAEVDVEALSVLEIGKRRRVRTSSRLFSGWNPVSACEIASYGLADFFIVKPCITSST